MSKPDSLKISLFADETTGGTDDYMKAINGVKQAICPELRGNSFIVDTSQIALSYNEIWNGLVVMFAAL